MHRACTGAAIGFIAGGLALVTETLAGFSSSQYAHAAICPSSTSAPQPGAACYRRVAATVLASRVTLGANNPQLTLNAPALSPRPITLQISRPPGTFYSIYAGQTAWLKIWHGIITAIYAGTGPNNATRTPDNPYELDRLWLSEGLSVLAVGGALLFIAPPRFTGEWIRRQTRWHLSDNGAALQQTFSNAHLAIPLGSFILLQLLDVATSVKGSLLGLYEDTPTASLLIAQWGPIPAFTALKFPAIVITILAIPRLPYRLAVLLAWTGVGVMAYIVLQNAWLIGTGSHTLIPQRA